MVSRPEPIGDFRREIGESLSSLREGTLRAVLAATGAVLWLWMMSKAAGPNDYLYGWGLPASLLLVDGLCFLLCRHSHHSAALLHIGALFCAFSALVRQGDTSVAPFLFVPVVLMAGALYGSRAAFLTSGLASLVVLSARPPGEAVAQPAVLASAVALAWVIALISWVSTRSLHTTLHWALMNEEQASRNLEESRSYQGRLVQALRQLEEANYRLERANYALSWARAEAEQARKLKAQFAANVSHELRTPINLIVGFGDLMLSHPEAYGGVSLPRAYLADLTAINRSARHLEGLIDDILDLSQMEAGAMPVVKEVTDIASIIHEAVATGRPLLDRKHLQVTVEVAPDLPLMYLDRLRIRQAILNLLNNASRFTEQGGVTVRAFLEGDQVLIEVADTGVGIDPQHLSRIFEAYVQVDTSVTRGKGGTGLGLAISKRFVELHGGRISARSSGTPGEGSVFTVALPTQQVDSFSPADCSGGPLSRWEVPGEAPPPTVAVLEDDPAVVSILRRHLEGYRVVGVGSEEEAMRLATTCRLHALVTDAPSAEELGEWYRHWLDRAVHIGLRVWGCPMPTVRGTVHALGLADYLVKPVARDALLETVRSVAPQARLVLVVDDDPEMVKLLCRMLSSASKRYRFMRALGGGEALDLMRRNQPDLVLLDILMPQVDGLTVLERMRRDPMLTAIPVIAVSARGPAEEISPSPNQGIVMVNNVPFAPRGLLRSLQMMLDSFPPAVIDHEL